MHPPTSGLILDEKLSDNCICGQVRDIASHVIACIVCTRAQMLRFYLCRCCGQLLGVSLTLRQGVAGRDYDLPRSIQSLISEFSSAAALHRNDLATLRRQAAKLRVDATELRARIVSTRAHIRRAILALR